MTQPTDRPGINHLTSDMLDQLYADRDRYRNAWHSARERAQAHSEGTLRHVADRDAWKSWTKKAEEAIQYWYDAAVERLERAEKAEATLTAVSALATDTRRYTGPGADSYQLGKYDLADAVLAVLDQHGQTTV